eukprot:10657279-Karenia_brevis.AAC.1
MIYLERPRGGLPGLEKGQLLVARKGIYGFAEAARLFWLVLQELLVADGWIMSELVVARFSFGGYKEGFLEMIFEKTRARLEFSAWNLRDFPLRG